MTIFIAVGVIWIAINGALAIALLMRRDRPETRRKLMAWVLRGERRADVILKRPRTWYCKRRQIHT